MKRNRLRQAHRFPLNNDVSRWQRFTCFSSGERHGECQRGGGDSHLLRNRPKTNSISLTLHYTFTALHSTGRGCTNTCYTHLKHADITRESSLRQRNPRSRHRRCYCFSRRGALSEHPPLLLPLRFGAGGIEPRGCWALPSIFSPTASPPDPFPLIPLPRSVVHSSPKKDAFHWAVTALLLSLGERLGEAHSFYETSAAIMTERQFCFRPQSVVNQHPFCLSTVKASTLEPKTLTVKLKGCIFYTFLSTLRRRAKRRNIGARQKAHGQT